MTPCREAWWLPSAGPYYYATIGDADECWEEVRRRADGVICVQRDVQRPPWTRVYQVLLCGRERYYLVAELPDPPP